jgi:hypothetical protein
MTFLAGRDAGVGCGVAKRSTRGGTGQRSHSSDVGGLGRDKGGSETMNSTTTCSDKREEEEDGPNNHGYAKPVPRGRTKRPKR